MKNFKKEMLCFALLSVIRSLPAIHTLLPTFRPSSAILPSYPLGPSTDLSRLHAFEGMYVIIVHMVYLLYLIDPSIFHISFILFLNLTYVSESKGSLFVQ